MSDSEDYLSEILSGGNWNNGIKLAQDAANIILSNGFSSLSHLKEELVWDVGVSELRRMKDKEPYKKRTRSYLITGLIFRMKDHIRKYKRTRGKEDSLENFRPDNSDEEKPGAGYSNLLYDNKIEGEWDCLMRVLLMRKLPPGIGKIVVKILKKECLEDFEKVVFRENLEIIQSTCLEITKTLNFLNLRRN